MELDVLVLGQGRAMNLNKRRVLSAKIQQLIRMQMNNIGLRIKSGVTREPIPQLTTEKSKIFLWRHSLQAPCDYRKVLLKVRRSFFRIFPVGVRGISSRK